MLRTIGCARGEPSSSTGSKGKWSPEEAKDLFYLLNKKTIKREKEEEKKQEGRRAGRKSKASFPILTLLKKPLN